MNSQLLLVDDDPNFRLLMTEWLENDGFQVLEAADAASAEAALDSHRIALVLLDLALPGCGGMRFLQELVAADAPPVVVVTANHAISMAVEAVKLGAVDYLTKPVELAGVSALVRRYLEQPHPKQRKRGSSGRAARFGLQHLVGESPAIVQVKELVRRVAQGDTTAVLILGESGTGKDMVARAIHYESARVDKPFINITCTALPENLLESELFGYEQGSFTNALKQKKGLVELADGGTLFLDEIGDMSPLLQAKLLRVLEDKSFRRIGGAEDIEVDLRVVTATNRNLLECVEKGTFREDLYYRICTIPMAIPPLRERDEDVTLLANHFLAFYNGEFNRTCEPLSEAVLDHLRHYHWPGNVRELRNVMERAVLLSGSDTLTVQDFALGRRVALAPSSVFPFQLPEEGCSLEAVEQNLVLQALARVNNNQTRAAKLLGLSRDQLRYKMEKHGIRTRGPDLSA